MPNGTGGVQAPTSYGGNTNSGSGSSGPGKTTRRRNGKTEYRWKNGSWHSRRQGAQYRPDTPSGGGGGGGGGNGGGGTPGPSKHPYLDMARNDATLAYGGAEQSQNQRGQAIPSWFQNYRNQLTGQQAASNAYAAPILAQAQTNAQQAGQVAPGVDPNSQAGQDATLAAAARASLGNAFVGLLQGFGQAQNQYMNGQQTVASVGELGAQQDLASDRTTLKKEKGAYIASQRAKHKDDARQALLENQAFGLDVTKANNDAANTAADNRRQDRQATQTRRDQQGAVNKYGFTEKAWRGKSTAERQKIIRQFDKSGSSGGSGGSGFTPNQVSDARVKLRKGVSAIKRALEGKSTAPVDFWKKAYNDLLDAGYDPLMARAAIQVVRQGKVGGNIQRRLKRDYGIRHTPRGKPFKKPPAYTLNPAPQAPGPGGSEYRPT